MPIVLNGTNFNNGGSATLNGTALSEIKDSGTTVWKKETTETGSLSVKGLSEDPNNITYPYGWYEKSFNIPVGTTFRLNYFKFESNGTPFFFQVQVLVNGNSVISTGTSQAYTYDSGAKPSSTGTYTSTVATNTLRLRARIAINNAISTGDYWRSFLWSVFQS